MLACWFGNRPPGRSRDWRPVVRLPADFSRPGLPHTRGGSPEKCQRTWMPTLFFPIAIGMGAIFQSPQTPIGAFTQLWQVHTDLPATTAKTSCIRAIIARGYRDIELQSYIDTFCHLSLQDVFLSNKNPL